MAVLLGIRLIALNGLNTRIVRIAVKFKLSICRQYSKTPAHTIKQSNLFQVSARYVPGPYNPMAIILINISIVKKTNIISSKTYKIKINKFVSGSIREINNTDLKYFAFI